ncbi:MAG: hypothetical protein ACOYUZ_00730 [Patescibacteria group bacterium]
MIKSFGSTQKNDYFNIIIIIAMFLSARIFTGIALGEAYHTPLELLWQISWLTAAVSLNYFWFCKIRKMHAGIFWQRFYLSLLMGSLGGVIVFILPIWTKSLSALPLTLSEIPKFIFTFGAFPGMSGPDALIRGAAIFTTISFFVLTYIKEKDLFRGLIDAVCMWILFALTMVLPSILLLLFIKINGVSILTSSEDLIGEFTRLNLNTYWVNGQIVRWFSGFGGQALNSFILLSSSFVYVLGLVSWLLSAANQIRYFLKTINFNSWMPVITALLAGILIAWNRGMLAPLNLITWFVFFGSLAALFLAAVLQDDTDKRFGRIFAFLGAGLLGWPFLMVFIVLAVSVFAYFNIIKMQNPGRFFEKICLSLIWLLLSLCAIVFLSRGDAVKDWMMQLAAGFGIMVLALNIIESEQADNKFSLWRVTVWVLGIAIASLIIKTFVVLAAGLLVLGLYFAYIVVTKKSFVIKTEVFWVALLLTQILILWLPRMPNGN